MSESIVHMNIPACEEVRNQMATTKQTLEEQMNTIAGRVDGMVGQDWIAPAAEQFKGDFQEWKNQVIQALNRLEEMTNNFQAEINRTRENMQNYTS